MLEILKRTWLHFLRLSSLTEWEELSESVSLSCSLVKRQKGIGTHVESVDLCVSASLKLTPTNSQDGCTSCKWVGHCVSASLKLGPSDSTCSGSNGSSKSDCH